MSVFLSLFETGSGFSKRGNFFVFNVFSLCFLCVSCVFSVCFCMFSMCFCVFSVCFSVFSLCFLCGHCCFLLLSVLDIDIDRYRSRIEIVVLRAT